jgi:hypothetical protein
MPRTTLMTIALVAALLSGCSRRAARHATHEAGYAPLPHVHVSDADYGDDGAITTRVPRWLPPIPNRDWTGACLGITCPLEHWTGWAHACQPIQHANVEMLDVHVGPGVNCSGAAHVINAVVESSNDDPRVGWSAAMRVNHLHDAEPAGPDGPDVAWADHRRYLTFVDASPCGIDCFVPTWKGWQQTCPDGGYSDYTFGDVHVRGGMTCAQAKAVMIRVAYAVIHQPKMTYLQALKALGYEVYQRDSCCGNSWEYATRSSAELGFETSV